MIIGFTGTREGMTKAQKKKFSFEITEGDRWDVLTEFHHGDCIGADEQSQDIVDSNFEGIIPVIIHPPINKIARAFCEGSTILKPKDYIERNHDIVDSCDLLIACPKEDKEIIRSGTWATIRYAIKKKVDTLIIYPNGKTKYISQEGKNG